MHVNPINNSDEFQVDATRGLGYADELPPGFFDNTQANFHVGHQYFR
jgi:hypothetical protein